MKAKQYVFFMAPTPFSPSTLTLGPCIASSIQQSLQHSISKRLMFSPSLGRKSYWRKAL